MHKTKSGLPECCSYQRSRPGDKPRVRVRRNGKLLGYITGVPWSADFMQRRAALLETAAPQPISNGRAIAGTLGALIDAYEKKVLPLRGEGTQAMRRPILKRLRAEHSVAGATSELLEAIILKKATTTPHAANTLRKLLRVLFKYGSNGRCAPTIRCSMLSASRPKRVAIAAGKMPRSHNTALIGHWGCNSACAWS